MVDSNRQPIPRNESAPFTVVGVQGGIGNLPTVQQPAVPQIAVEDNTAQFFGQAQQSIQNAYDYQQSTIESNRQASVAEAQARERNPFPNQLSGIIGNIQAGIGLYQETQQRKADQLNQALAAELEQAVMEQGLQLRKAFYDNASDEGLIPTYTAAFRTMRQQYIDQGLDPAIAQQIINMGFQGLYQTQEEQGVKYQAELEDFQAERRQTILNDVMLTGIMPIVNEMQHGRLYMQPEAGVAIIEQILTDYTAQYELSPLDALQMRNGVYSTVAAAMESAGANAATIRRRQSALSGALEQAYAINSQLGGNTEARNAAFSLLQQQLADEGINVTLTDIFQTDFQRLEQQLGLQQQYTALQNAQREGRAQNNPQLNEGQRRAMSILTASNALTWINNPNNYAQEIELGSDADAPPEQRAAYRLYTDFQEDRKRYNEAATELADIQIQRASIVEELAVIAQQVDPTGQLGRPVVTIPYVNQLAQTVGAQERPEVSQRLAAARQQVQQYTELGLDEQERILNSERQQLAQEWFDVGIYIDDPSNTTRINSLLDAVQPDIDAAMQLMNAPPDPMLGFPLGLPRLPRR